MVDKEVIQKLGHALADHSGLTDVILDGRDHRESPLHQLFALCEHDPECNAVLRKYGANRRMLERAYRTLSLNGAGQWIGNHYVACSVLAYPALLDHFLANRDRPPIEVITELIAKISSGEVDQPTPQQPATRFSDSVHGKVNSSCGN